VEKKEKVGPNEDQPLGRGTKRTVLAYQDVFNVESGKAVKRTPLDYGDLFNVESGKRPVRKVLVEGGAGIGKTTLCIAISEDWANEKLFQQFKLLLLLPLRHRKVSSAQSLSELLKLLHSSKNVCESVVNYLEEEQGENVLIIADGWDELDESQQQEDSFLYELLLVELPFASVLITSRPSASDPLRKYMDRFIDVLGFDKKNIEEFILAEFADNLQKATGLSKQLESNPLLESVCSVPLNCAIVCHLWRTLEEALPTTMTELYQKIMLNFILRNIRKANMYRGIKILTDFDSLPSNLHQSWWRLCEFACQALIKNQIVFSQKDLGEFKLPVDLDESLFFFGLIQPTETILETGCGVSYHFLHLTFQEYLAALHLVKCPLDKLTTLFQSSNSDLNFYKLSSNFTMIWRFYFGIYFHESKKHSRKPDINIVKQHISGIKSNIRGKLLPWQCAFEANSKDIVDENLASNCTCDDVDDRIYGLKGCSVVDFGEPSNAHDCAAILHGISNIESCNTSIRFGNCSVREKQIETLGKILADKEGKVQIMELDLSGNKLTDRSICNLFQKASTAFLSLESLDLRDNEIGVESIESIITSLKQLPFNVLSKLDLSQNPLGVPGLKALEDGICCSTLVNLTDLVINEADVTDVSCEHEISLGVAVAAHCPIYKLGDIDDYDDDSPAIPGQPQLKRRDGVLTELSLIGCNLSDIFVCELLLRSSTAFQSLKILNLSGNQIGVETIKAISLILQGIPYNLDLSINPLGVPGVKALEDAIRCDTLVQLTELILVGSLTGVNCEQRANLIVAIGVHCPNMGKIDLSPDIGIPGVSTDARLMSKKCDGKLTELELTGSCLSDKFVNELFLRSSTAFQSLEILNVSNNEIGVETIKALSSILQALPSNTLQILDLSNNPLGVSGLQALEDMVCCDLLANLQQLSLQKSLKLTSDADINGALLTTFTKALSEHSPMLKSLDLSQNNLSIVPGASTISRGSIYIKQGVLNLNNTMFGDAGLNILVENFDEECHAHTVNLMNNNIHGSGVSLLVDNIKQCHDINLSDNPIGLEGVLAIGRFISDSCCQLNRLVLSKCQLTLSGDNPTTMYGEKIRDTTQQLCQMAPNSTLTTVELQSIDFSEERIHILAGIIYLCPNLKHLNSSHCQINSNDCKLLLQQLIELKESSPKVCSKLVEWDLSDNKIDDDGASILVIIDHLVSLFSHLGCDIKFNLYNNPISSAIVLMRLREEGQKMFEIEEGKTSSMVLYHNNINPLQIL
jgi:5S rRNA maturation endonuclease (ribonuclease M5)